MEWTRKHLLTLEDLSVDEIRHIIGQAQAFKGVSTRSVKKVPALRGRVVVNFFAEPSTRTRTSFALAAARLSADVVDVSEVNSSTTKGETLVDTARNIEAMGIDVMVIRHSLPGAPKLLSEHLNASIINAGDGAHEHPTQGLLDLFTIIEKCGDDLSGLKVALVGDITHSRVARSNIWALTKFGAEVTVVGPATLIPNDIKQLGVRVCHHLDDVLGEFDVVNLLRIQKERQKAGLFPSIREYSRLYGINKERLARMKKDVIIMHPGPINRGVEITDEVADGKNSVILKQVENGLAVRMAVLFLVVNAQQ